MLAALQDVALTYLRRDVVATIPFWRQAAASVDELRRRAEAIVEATRSGRAGGDRRRARRGVGPGHDHPLLRDPVSRRPRRRAAGNHAAGDRRARDGATWLDLRTVEPADDAVLVAALRRYGAVAV